MFFAFKKYTILHPRTETNYGLLQINEIFTSQSYPYRMGSGGSLDIPW
jgi:hypothetical protein